MERRRGAAAAVASVSAVGETMRAPRRRPKAPTLQTLGRWPMAARSLQPSNPAFLHLQAQQRSADPPR